MISSYLPLHLFRGVFPGKFDRRLVGLRPAVAEKYLVEAGILHEKPGQKDLVFDMVEIRDMGEESPPGALTASTTRGWEWPRAQTAIPPTRSR